MLNCLNYVTLEHKQHYSIQNSVIPISLACYKHQEQFHTSYLFYYYFCAMFAPVHYLQIGIRTCPALEMTINICTTYIQ